MSADWRTRAEAAKLVWSALRPVSAAVMSSLGAIVRQSERVRAVASVKYRFRASSRFWRPKAAAATVAGLCFCLTVLASCGSSDPKTLTRPTGATPAVTEATAELPVPGGCPTSADVANAALGEPEEGDGYAAVDVELLNNFLETALPTAGACAYAELERRTASSSDATYRRIEVFYFNLGEPARPTADSLKYWANQAGAVDTSDEGDGRAYELPESFSGWTGGAISLDDDSTTWFLGDEDLIPEYTDRDNIRSRSTSMPTTLTPSKRTPPPSATNLR